MKIHLIHGIHATTPGGNTAKLAVYFRAMGHEPVVHSYGYAFASTSFLPGWTNHLNRKRAAKLAPLIADGDAVCCHSNGAAVTYCLMQLRWLSRVVMVQPALDEDVLFPDLTRVLCIYNAFDEVVGASMILPGNYWGGMGKLGYKGPGPHNVESWDACDPPHGLPPYKGHLDMFDRKNIAAWGTTIGSWFNNRE